MIGRAVGAVLAGIEARLIEVEVDLGGGLPTIAAVGLPDGAVREGIDRIRAALPHAGFRLPQRRVIVNLAPADVRKRGAGLDLPIAVALLGADAQMARLDPGEVVLAGELGLDGSVRPVPGILAVALAARRSGRRRVIVPAANADEAALVEGVEVVAASTLADVAALARGPWPAPHRFDPSPVLEGQGQGPGRCDLGEVRGQAAARRALEIAAAGAHHLLLVGPPGAGKTLLARRLPSILPPLVLAEAIEITRVWSAAGLTRTLVTERPFRSPHHGISATGLLGGGPWLRPGEVSLASHGVLYLDELPEFRRDALEALRQPLEEGAVHLVRIREAAVFPARCMLIASMNPCPCGWHGSPSGRCGCSPHQVQAYLGKLSGPLLDRFDLLVEVPPVDLESLAASGAGEPSAPVRARVTQARRRQRARFGDDGLAVNGRMGPADLDRQAPLDPPSRALLLAAAARLGLSARGFDRVRRVARTLADLEGADRIGPEHVAEAVRYRRRVGLVPD
jgi:magnesium chelatase family protein